MKPKKAPLNYLDYHILQWLNDKMAYIRQDYSAALSKTSCKLCFPQEGRFLEKPIAKTSVARLLGNECITMTKAPQLPPPTVTYRITKQGKAVLRLHLSGNGNGEQQ